MYIRFAVHYSNQHRYNFNISSTTLEHSELEHALTGTNRFSIHLDVDTSHPVLHGWPHVAFQCEQEEKIVCLEQVFCYSLCQK